MFKIFDVLERGEAACHFKSYIYLRNMHPSTSSVAVPFFYRRIPDLEHAFRFLLSGVSVVLSQEALFQTGPERMPANSTSHSESRSVWVSSR